jgi:hypothetical protein
MFSSNLLKKLALLSPFLAALPSVGAVYFKRGLGANEQIPIWQFGGEWEGDVSNVNWQYNWDSTTSQKQEFAEYVPMLWGLTSDHTSIWFGNAYYWLSLPSGNSGHLLSFNEPEQSGQSNLSPADAANGYRQYMHPFIGQAQLGAPAVSNDGYDWLYNFMKVDCSDCHIDFVPIHWYNDHTLFSDFQGWVTEVCNLVGRPVWITEVCF